ncbi:uncharacterized protein BO96DRAFT_95992 [Aspergillus niger CBS 101883]|uniref:uncharacterized protein n=1 Tax=Aspergillus lacticoffeatus (strain CBS 101883) TaxID=1450533 RepID=UPI000D7EEE56|nr:uncharacterized protein BO96DRAFT_95992 [Aspergillus niger CBS 101883]PYH61376.1 hypothetical protein BO96DRAFT_95992 [Aspergillus niger CBS 101883]
MANLTSHACASFVANWALACAFDRRVCLPSTSYFDCSGFSQIHRSAEPYDGIDIIRDPPDFDPPILHFFSRSASRIYIT